MQGIEDWFIGKGMFYFFQESVQIILCFGKLHVAYPYKDMGISILQPKL